MTATVHQFARPVHTAGAAVPSGVAPPALGGAVAATHPTRPQAGVGGGPARRPQSVSHIARPVAPTTTSPAAGAVVVGALFGPAGTRSPSPRNTRPGPHGGDAA